MVAKESKTSVAEVTEKAAFLAGCVVVVGDDRDCKVLFRFPNKRVPTNCAKIMLLRPITVRLPRPVLMRGYVILVVTEVAKSVIGSTAARAGLFITFDNATR
jgi:hypothetical protein